MAAAALRGRPCRSAVLLLLVASVLAPLVLYDSDFPVLTLPDTTASRGAFDRGDVSNLVWWPHMDASEVSLAKDLKIERLGEHKNRLLSVADEWQGVDAAKSISSEKSDGSVQQQDTGSLIAEGNVGAQSGQDGIIKEVFGTERSTDGFGDPGDSRETEAQYRHTTEILNSSFQKESTADRLSEKTLHATPKESYTRTINVNAALSTTISDLGHSVTAPDATIHIIKDQLTRAKSYLGFIASRGNHGFSKELRARMRDIKLALGDATSDVLLPQNVHGKIKAMEETLGKLKRIHDKCLSAVNRLRASLHSTEKQLESQKRAVNYLGQIAAKSLSKGLHCLPLRLTNEYYSTNSYNVDFPNMEKLEDPKLYHYAVFSDNVLAAAVVVNSTLVHAKQPANHVFHIVTGRLNYAAMRMWFLANPLGKAAVQVQNIDEFTWLNSSYSPVLKQLESQSTIDYDFISGKNLNHLRFYLPEIFPKLNKVLFLDDDTVVQQDLGTLWSINLNGKVNGAVETCGETFLRFDKYLNFSNPLIANNFHPHACGWAYGMNMFDLLEWRKQNITKVYHTWQKLNEDRLLWKLGTLPAGLVTFWNHTFPLDRSWHLLGLGYDPNVNEKDIRRASVIHYNGNLKPWLEVGLSKYRKYWSKYVDFDRVFLRECNINP